MMKTAETRIARSGIILGAVSALTLAISSGAMAEVLITDYSNNDIKVGNAGAECAQLAGLLSTEQNPVEFVYAYKWNECQDEAAGCEGAPNQSELAEFYDPDGILDHENTIAISGSNGSVFNWGATNSIGAVMVKAGTGYKVYSYNPQEASGSGLVAFENKAVSHVTFCWNPDDAAVAEATWCSPGYWRQEHHEDSWDVTGYLPTDQFVDALPSQSLTLSRQGVKADASTDPTLWMVLQSPQYYGGDAFNAVGDLLSGTHPDVNFTGERVEDSCPLN
jgi:hypothetical protein